MDSPGFVPKITRFSHTVMPPRVIDVWGKVKIQKEKVKTGTTEE